MDQPLHVIIVGGGLAGLAVAQGLKKNGISYVVVDKETHPRGRNWGITISWSHADLAEILPDDLYKRLNECQPDPSLDSGKAGCESVLVRDGKTGETMVEPSFPGIRRFNIQKTKKLWSNGLNVKYGKHLVDIDMTPSGPTARFEDGTSETGTVIIGADGGSSRVRSWLLGDLAKPESLPYTFMNFPVQYNAEQALFIQEKMHPIVDVGTHPKGMYIGLFLLDKPDLESPETWTYYILASWPMETEDDEGDSASRLQMLRSRMDDWAEPFKSAVAWAPDDTEIGPDHLKIWGTKPWDNHGGRVTLAGDAAHAMTFHRGQGGNVALRDGHCFVDAMLAVQGAEKSRKEALDEYDEGVRDRGKEVEVSRAQTEAIHDHANFMKSPIMSRGIMPTTKADS